MIASGAHSDTSDAQNDEKRAARGGATAEVREARCSLSRNRRETAASISEEFERARTCSHACAQTAQRALIAASAPAAKAHDVGLWTRESKAGIDK